MHAKIFLFDAVVHAPPGGETLIVILCEQSVSGTHIDRLIRPVQRPPLKHLSHKGFRTLLSDLVHWGGHLSDNYLTNYRGRVHKQNDWRFPFPVEYHFRWTYSRYRIDALSTTTTETPLFYFGWKRALFLYNADLIPGHPFRNGVHIQRIRARCTQNTTEFLLAHTAVNMETD